MRETGCDFSDVLKEAQEKGYAESDPSFDIDGVDAAHKLSLLSALAFGVKPEFARMVVRGIRNITAMDITYATELGYRIKLLGMARRIDGSDKIIQVMESCLVPIESPIGSVEGVYNGIFMRGDFVGKTLLVGRGAGAGPTASAVLSDIIDAARGVSHPVFGIPAKDLKQASWAAPSDVLSHYYIHLQVLDQPGVLADVSAVLRDHKISVEAVIQRGHNPDQPVSIVLTTHEVHESDIYAAAKDIQKMKFMVKEPTIIRIETF